MIASARCRPFARRHLTRCPCPARCAAQSIPTGADCSMSLTPEAIATLSRVSTATITTVLLKKGLRNVWMRGSRAAAAGTAPAGRAGLHAAFRAGAGGSGDAGILVVADLDPHRDRGHAGRLHRRGRRHGRHRRRHLRRHSVRAHGQARRGGAGHRRRGARSRRRARHRPAGVVRRLMPRRPRSPG